MWTFISVVSLISLQTSYYGVNCYESIRPKRQEYTCTTLNGDPGICTSVKEYKAMLELFISFKSNESDKPLPTTEVPPSMENITKPPSSTQTLENDDSENFNYFPSQCGKSLVSTDRRIAGVAPLNAWPWLALLGYPVSDNSTGWYCGGFLITNLHVLTAAHCFHSTKPVKVRLGAHQLDSPADNSHHVDIEIKKIIQHPAFNISSITYNDDITVVVLKDPVIFTAGIRPICLPFPSQLRHRNFTGVTAYIAGWGAAEEHSRKPSNVPLETRIGVVNRELCTHDVDMIDNRRPFQEDNVICAGGGINSASKGDSGYPLMIQEDGQIFAIGLTSHVVAKDHRSLHKHIAYVRLAHYLKWIAVNTVYNPVYDLSSAPL